MGGGGLGGVGRGEGAGDPPTKSQVHGVCHWGGSLRWMPGVQLCRQTATLASLA